MAPGPSPRRSRTATHGTHGTAIACRAEPHGSCSFEGFRRQLQAGGGGPGCALVGGLGFTVLYVYRDLLSVFLPSTSSHTADLLPLQGHLQVAFCLRPTQPLGLSWDAAPVRSAVARRVMAVCTGLQLQAGSSVFLMLRRRSCPMSAGFCGSY